jgi:hypothetical protein
MTTKALSNVLTKLELDKYVKCKHTVRMWIEDTFAVGLALAEVQDGKLYRQDYDTFEEFTLKEFKLERSRAYQLIEAANVQRHLPAGARKLIVNEAQARALASVPAEKREAVVIETATRGEVTAKAITEVATEGERNRIEQKDSAPPKDTKPKAVEHSVDKTGVVIPPSILDDWKRAEEFAELLKPVKTLKLTVQRGIDGEELAFAEITNPVVAGLANALRELERVEPHAVCPTCQGLQRAKCTLCKRRGWISKFLYSTVVTEKQKGIRERGAKK